MSQDHRDRMIDKLKKMAAARDGEAKIGNIEASEAFAAAINRMLLDNELSVAEIDYTKIVDVDPVIELYVDYARYGVERKQRRIDWTEMLARIVAKAHLCTFMVVPGSNAIWFVGTKSHATVAEYVFGTLIPVVERMCYLDYRRYRQSIPRVGDSYKRPASHGFQEAWLNAFLKRIAQRFEDAKAAAVAHASDSSTALMRLNNALVKTSDYMNEKKGLKSLKALAPLTARNAEGEKRGRAAADAVELGRKAVTTSSAKQLT